MEIKSAIFFNFLSSCPQIAFNLSKWSICESIVHPQIQFKHTEAQI